MKAGVGGNIGPVRAGVSNKGAGVGMGSLSEGVSTGSSRANSGGTLGFIGAGIGIIICLMLLVVFGPIALLVSALVLLKRGRGRAALATLLVGGVLQWGAWHFVERTMWDRWTNGVKVEDLSWKSESEARRVLDEQGIRNVDVKYPRDRGNGSCYVRDQKPDRYQTVGRRYETVELEMSC